MSSPFLVGHATHPDWRGALALAAAQVDAQRARVEGSGAAPLSLGLVYFTDHHAAEAEALLAALRERWPGVAWAGCCGVGVCASGVEYVDEPALVLMLAPLAPGRFEVFSGAHPISHIVPFTALVHADPETPDLAELVAEMSDRTTAGYVFGGVAAARSRAVHIADGVWQGGLSGVAFGREVPVISRVTQGCQPIGPTRTITACDRNVVIEIDHQPALPLLLEDLGIVDGSRLREAVPRLRGTLVGLTDSSGGPSSSWPPLAAHDGVPPPALKNPFGDDTRVRHLVGIDPARRSIAVADRVEPGMRIAFCQRDVQAARRDLVRICSEIREEVESGAETGLEGVAAGVQAGAGAPLPDAASRIRGAVYVSCAGRGGAHFGGPSAELQIVRRALGDVPLVGFFAAGEIGHRHLYGYTGVLTVFPRGR